jgi:histidine kinase-like protein/STAS domain-containing protein
VLVTGPAILRTWEDQGVLVVAAQGPLDLERATSLYRAVAKCLAEEPAAVVVDLSGVPLERNVRTALRRLARLAADRPATSLAVAGVPTDQARLLQSTADRRAFRVWSTVEEAVEHAHERVPRRRVRRLIGSSGQAPAQARSLVTETCRAWNVSAEATAAAATVMSELATNAVVHAGGDLQVGVELAEDALIVTVRDGSPVPPRLRTARRGRESGRGLAIVAELSRAWGCVPVAGDGKVVWARLSA